MALEVTEEQKIIWKALKKRNAYFAKKKTRACCPTMEAFIEKERNKSKNCRPTMESFIEKERKRKKNERRNARISKTT